MGPLSYDMDGRLKNPHAIYVCAELGQLPEDCIYASGNIGLSIGPHNTIQYNTCLSDDYYVNNDMYFKIDNQS